jgi:hypothetical protein
MGHHAADDGGGKGTKASHNDKWSGGQVRGEGRPKLNSGDDTQATDEVNDSTVTKQPPPANEEQEDKKNLPPLEDESRTKMKRDCAPLRLRPMRRQLRQKGIRLPLQLFYRRSKAMQYMMHVWIRIATSSSCTSFSALAPARYTCTSFISATQIQQWKNVIPHSAIPAQPFSPCLLYMYVLLSSTISYNRLRKSP